VKVWSKEDPLQIEDIVVKSENLKESPINSFLAKLELQVSQSKDMKQWAAKFDMDANLEHQVDKMKDEIMDHFFTKEFHPVLIETEQFVYMGTVNRFNKPEGIGRIIFSNNSIHEGAFKNGQPCGFGRRCDPSGTVFNGIYEQGIRKGKGTLTDGKGHQRKGTWASHRFEGIIGAASTG
jgi:hypothetical protein